MHAVIQINFLILKIWKREERISMAQIAGKSCNSKMPKSSHIFNYPTIQFIPKNNKPTFF